MIVTLAIVALLLALNALFVAAEFAVVGAPRAAIDASAARNNRMARVVQGVLNDPRRQDRYIATSQIGVTVASLGLGMYGEHVLAAWVLGQMNRVTWLAWLAAHGAASVAAIAVLTYFHIVLGEMLPKTLALQAGERFTLWITPLMLWIQTVLLPLVIVLNAIGNVVLRLIGIDRGAHSQDEYYTPEELQLVVEESEAGGAIRAEAGRVLRELFEFGELTAGEAMVPRVRVTGIPVGTPACDLRAILGRTPHTRYPVFDGDLDHIVGTYHIKELLRLMMHDLPVTAAGARPAPLVPETAMLDTLLEMMRRERAQIAVVIDEHGGTSGLITLEDLFEEVVGEIDEGLAAVEPPRRDAQGRALVPGTMRLDDLGQQFDLELTHPEVDSVSGLVLAILGRPPVVGDVVTYDRVRLEVTAVMGHGVDTAAVSVVPADVSRRESGDA